MTDPASTAPKHVIIYTDGACSGNPGPGGWGAVLNFKGKEKELFGGEKQTTNNRMEMTAALEALRALKEPCLVTIHTDSKYLMQGITEWMAGWRRKGWKTASGDPVKNVDLWQALDQELKRHKATWVWVKGHAGNAGNERADALARKGVKDCGK